MKARHTLPLVLLCVLALVMAIAASCGGGPVPADQAQMEMTFTGDGTSYVGDREIIEGGPATVTFSNETTGPVIVVAWRYETGSDELAEELERLPEGSKADWSPSGPAGPLETPEEFTILDDAWPGSNSYTMHLLPGTYLFDAAPEDYKTNGLWRAAIIEVVAE